MRSIDVLVASSPVEIDAEATQIGLPPAAHDAARHLFHALTDRLGRVVAAIGVGSQDWPTHRFYFSTEPDGLTPLIAGLQGRPDILDVTETVPAAPDAIAGLYCRAAADGCAAVLVGHENHEGYLSPHST